MLMELEAMARFLDEHPDWSPAVLMEEDDTPVFHGFYGPQGGYFSLDEIARLVAGDPQFARWWRKP